MPYLPPLDWYQPGGWWGNCHSEFSNFIGRLDIEVLLYVYYLDKVVLLGGVA